MDNWCKLNLAFMNASVHEIEFANSIRLKAFLNYTNTIRLFKGLLGTSIKRLIFLIHCQEWYFHWKVSAIFIWIILQSGFNFVHGYLQ